MKTSPASGGSDATARFQRGIADYAGKRTPSVGVVFNSVSEKMVRLADEALEGAASYNSGSGEVTISTSVVRARTIGTFSRRLKPFFRGSTPIPKRDCLVIGKLDLDERFVRYGRRVKRIPLQPWQALPKLLTSVDINLAPLEPNNPVTECESCVKSLEAGLLAVPTVASPNPDFVRTAPGRTHLPSRQ